LSFDPKVNKPSKKHEDQDQDEDEDQDEDGEGGLKTVYCWRFVSLRGKREGHTTSKITTKDTERRPLNKRWEGKREEMDVERQKKEDKKT